DGGCAPQLFRRPKPFTRKRPAGLMMNQTDQVQLVGHGGELSANGLQGEKETAVVHNRNSAVETNRRTMNFQRTANCVLTVCLSPGAGSRLVYRLRLHKPVWKHVVILCTPSSCALQEGCNRLVRSLSLREPL